MKYVYMFWVNLIRDQTFPLLSPLVESNTCYVYDVHTLISLFSETKIKNVNYRRGKNSIFYCHQNSNPISIGTQNWKRKTICDFHYYEWVHLRYTLEKHSPRYVCVFPLSRPFSHSVETKIFLCILLPNEQITILKTTFQFTETDTYTVR